MGRVREAWQLGGTLMFQCGWRSGCEAGAVTLRADHGRHAKEFGSSY